MRYFKKFTKLNISFLIFILIVLTITVLSQPPKDFPKKQFNFRIEKGSSLSKIANDLYLQKIIANKFLFEIITVITSSNRGVMAGDYKFIKGEGVFSVSHRLVKGDQQQEKVKIVIPEGTNVADMAFIYLKGLSDFNAPRFVSLAKKHEGYLYPDTYYFLANTKSEEIIRTMLDNFNKKIKTLDSEIKTFNKPLKDIITMASIVEKEANSLEDQKIISGILWKRIDQGMLLQVDPPFYYITGKNTGVTYDDLKVDSPYNTYIHKGLPKGPISNPSIETIKATINPTASKYYFYLSSKEGVMKYSSTYNGHLDNKSLYLK